MRFRRMIPMVLLAGLLAPVMYGAEGQTAAPATNGQAAQTPAAPADSLGRETPRGCVMGFIKAAQDEHFDVATEYFQPQVGRRKRGAEDEEELAAQLLAIINQKFAGPLDFISRDPLGKLDDGLPPDQEKVAGVLGAADSFPLLLVRQEDSSGRRLWYISRATLERVPEVYDTLTFPELEKKIPDSLTQHRFLSMPLWQWLAMILFVPVALVFGRLVSLLAELFVYSWRKARGLPPMERIPLLKVGPITLMLAVLTHYVFVNYIGTSILYRIYYRHLIWVLLAATFCWLLMKGTRLISGRIGRSFTSRGMMAERSIVSLIRRFVDVSICLMVGLTVLHGFGVDVSTALAGLGIGGLALGLGAQKTFENMFGGISILFDKAIQVGDVCRVNNQVGVVEDIGLRSTRLRTPERTVLSIPNGTMSTATLENLRFRDKFLCQQVVRLRYDLSPGHVRYVLEQIRKLLDADEKVEESTARVRLLRFADYAIEVEIFCYILEPEYAVYLATQEALLLRVMDTLEAAGVVVALPSQATIMAQDVWKAPGIAAEKAEEAKRGDAGKRGEPK